MANEITFRMTSKRETKGNFVFEDSDPDATPKLRTMYVPKDVLREIGARGDIEVVIRPAN